MQIIDSFLGILSITSKKMTTTKTLEDVDYFFDYTDPLMWVLT